MGVQRAGTSGTPGRLVPLAAGREAGIGGVPGELSRVGWGREEARAGVGSGESCLPVPACNREGSALSQGFGHGALAPRLCVTLQVVPHASRFPEPVARLPHRSLLLIKPQGPAPAVRM